VDVRSLGYRTDLMARLLEGSHIDDRGGYLAIRSPHNASYWWGNFLLLAAPPEAGQAGEWLATFAAEFPAATHVTLGIDAIEIGAVDVGEFVAAGLRLERSAVLTANAVNEPPRPNFTAAYRQLSGDDDWRQAADLRAVLSEGEPSGEPAFLTARLAAQRALSDAGHGSWLGAFVDGQLVAQLGLVTDGSGIARYQDVETHPQWRGQGLGGTLVWRAGQHGLDNLGATMLVMAADPAYVAIRVYRSVGFVDAEAQIGFERQPD
jgi:GNAT superfamily N-acetyltransferase